MDALVRIVFGDSFRAEGSLSATGDSKQDGELSALRFIELPCLKISAMASATGHIKSIVGELVVNLPFDCGEDSVVP